MVDLDAKVVIDVIEGNASKDLGSWLDSRTPGWLTGVEVVATDLAESYRAGARRWPGSRHPGGRFVSCGPPGQPLPGWGAPAGAEPDPGHRGRKRDPLHRIRKLMLAGAERLEGDAVDRVLLGIRAGADPEDEVLGAWLAKESVRDVYLSDDPEDSETLLAKTIEGCRTDPVPDSGALGRTLARRRTEILAHHTTGASNEPSEGSPLIKKVKRAGHGFRSLDNDRPRILLHTGGVDWPAQRPPAARIRTRSPH